MYFFKTISIFFYSNITLGFSNFEQAPGVGDRQVGLVCCRPWGRKKVGHNWATELNWTELLNNVKY